MISVVRGKEGGRGEAELSIVEVRFGMKKDEVSPETSSGSKKEEKESREEKAGRAAIESEFSVLIDAEKSYEEQLKIGRPLFMSLLSTGTVANIGEEVGPLQGVSETMALMISFQADRQIRSVTSISTDCWKWKTYLSVWNLVLVFLLILVGELELVVGVVQLVTILSLMPS